VKHLHRLADLFGGKALGDVFREHCRANGRQGI
jgi:hypothetical protein